MAEEFNSFLSAAKKSPLDSKVNAFGDIIEKIMSIVLRIPDLVDNSLNGINQRLASLESRVNNLGAGSRGVAAPGGAPGALPVGGPPGGPPPPPGGPLGGPPPPPGGPRPGQPGPASPVSLRGAIMGELKQLFAKRKR